MSVNSDPAVRVARAMKIAVPDLILMTCKAKACWDGMPQEVRDGCTPVLGFMLGFLKGMDYVTVEVRKSKAAAKRT